MSELNIGAYEGDDSKEVDSMYDTLVELDRRTNGGSETFTTSDTVTPGIQYVFIDSTSSITVTIANSLNHRNSELVIKVIDEPISFVIVDLTVGTWNGTATEVNMQALGDFVRVLFDENGDGTVIDVTPTTVTFI